MNRIEAANRALFLHINGGGDTPRWLVNIAIGIADGLIYLIPILLLALWLWGGRTHRGLALKACLVTLAALGANQMIGALCWHPRPFMLGLGHAWLQHAADSSFPSDHMTVFAAIALTLLCGGALGLAAAVGAAGLAVAWARVFLGVHFPLDMAGAVLVAAGVCALVTPLWRRAENPVLTLAERLYRIFLAWPIAAGWIRR
ncbi:putative undecaprenyl-diphosphatase YbjG [mine drainage metagenome]|uniref:Putative undecaprenyl-diphosphatase YbjG n=1 Tax=mine drainage metagenome TaxID=410659 RepID=A0A1J5RWR8_9ZZZZ